MKEKGIKIAMGLFIILFFLDVISTLLNYSLLDYLEANPLYAFGGLAVPIVFNVLLIILIWYFYPKSSINFRFYFIFLLVTVILTRISVVYGNFQVFLNPPSVAYLESLGTEALQQMKNTEVMEIFLMNIMPIFSCLLTWSIFKLDHKIEKLWGDD